MMSVRKTTLALAAVVGLTAYPRTAQAQEDPWKYYVKGSDNPFAPRTDFWRKFTGPGNYVCSAQGSFGQPTEVQVLSNRVKVSSEAEFDEMILSFRQALLTKMNNRGFGLGVWCDADSRNFRSEIEIVPVSITLARPSRVTAASGVKNGPTKFGFGYCTMENERVYKEDMPVFVSSIFPQKSNTQLYRNNIDSQWLSYVRSLPGFQGGTRGGCGVAATEANAKRAMEAAAGVPLRSYTWAYRKETFWTPDK